MKKKTKPENPFTLGASVALFRPGATDITKRKQAEEELRHREEEHRRLIENTPEVVWKADEHGRVFFISEKIEKVFGCTRAEIYSEGERLWFGRMHLDDRERVREAYTK